MDNHIPTTKTAATVTATTTTHNHNHTTATTTTAVTITSATHLTTATHLLSTSAERPSIRRSLRIRERNGSAQQSPAQSQTATPLTDEQIRIACEAEPQGDPEYREHPEVVGNRNNQDYVEFVHQIYMVRGRTRPSPHVHEDARCIWTYEGREYGSDVIEELTTTWLNANHMGHRWRRTMFKNRDEKWYRVAVLSSLKQTGRKTKRKSTRKARELDETQDVTREEQQRERERKRNRNRKRKRKPRTLNMKCTPGCLALAMRYMGLTERMHKMCDLLHHSYTFRHVANILGFPARPVKVKCEKFQILEVNPTKLYLVQAMAKHIHDDRHLDNTHSIAIFNKRIFDINLKMLLLNRENLNACMLGGPEWVYSHASRAIEFTIQQKLQNIINTNIIQNLGSY